ncbi:hypothetical protein AVEN_256893-1 [Araneus ventricosus]|uniref:DUF4817 domain-containing protein n=1 Tax=Araneus ventricosus TaxID=182803 RepID=A0A4Y2CHW4_ARAVE|nr:hypothetical protein AVEN_256893-1 [Araneus ventricosus]
MSQSVSSTRTRHNNEKSVDKKFKNKKNLVLKENLGNFERKKKQKTKKTFDSDDDENCLCTYSLNPYEESRSGEQWVQCTELESGFESGTLRPQGRDLTIRPPKSEDTRSNARRFGWLHTKLHTYLLLTLDSSPIISHRLVQHKFRTTYNRNPPSKIPRRWIGRGGPIPWSPRSPDITPLDFFLWGYVKNIAYQSPILDTDELKSRITSAI